MAVGDENQQNQQSHADDERTLKQIIDELGLYPAEAFEFVQQGLGYTVHKLHGQIKIPNVSRHISGQQLCEGLREFALMQWGMLAETVLRRWNITKTIDFGKIVFTLVDNGFMQKTEHDNIEDFRNVFDFHTAFAAGYKIESKP